MRTSDASASSAITTGWWKRCSASFIVGAILSLTLCQLLAFAKKVRLRQFVFPDLVMPYDVESEKVHRARPKTDCFVKCCPFNQADATWNALSLSTFSYPLILSSFPTTIATLPP